MKQAYYCERGFPENIKSCWPNVKLDVTIPQFFVKNRKKQVGANQRDAQVATTAEFEKFQTIDIF